MSFEMYVWLGLSVVLYLYALYRFSLAKEIPLDGFTTVKIHDAVMLESGQIVLLANFLVNGRVMEGFSAHYHRYCIQYVGQEIEVEYKVINDEVCLFSIPEENRIRREILRQIAMVVTFIATVCLAVFVLKYAGIIV